VDVAVRLMIQRFSWPIRTTRLIERMFRSSVGTWDRSSPALSTSARIRRQLEISFGITDASISLTGCKESDRSDNCFIDHTIRL